jgi:hypothetical protein
MKNPGMRRRMSRPRRERRVLLVPWSPQKEEEGEEEKVFKEREGELGVGGKGGGRRRTREL